MGKINISKEENEVKMKNKRFRRANGLIFPIFSLSSDYGIGTFGKKAYDFVDFLKKAGFGYWQILPLGPTSYGDSPYQSFSSFAGNPYFIDLDILKDKNLLNESELQSLDYEKDFIDYGKLYNNRFIILKKAFERFDDKSIEEFKKREKSWLLDYSLFMAIKDKYDGSSWLDFPKKLRDRDQKALDEFYRENKKSVEFYNFLQYEFFNQWDDLKSYANSNDIEIIGDLPIYLALDSADSWVNFDILKLNKDDKRPEFLAAVPPDAYSADGQLWGNPTYDWDRLKKRGYEFLLKRIGKNLKLYDYLRLDHFRGFESYYEVKAGDKNARDGLWQKAYGDEFFEILAENLKDAKFIAEDLGFITKEVEDLKEKTGFPGMKVIQFAFGDDFKSLYLPHNYEKNSIVYSSTHDSDTLKGWLDGLDRKKKDMVYQYFNIKDQDPSWVIIRALMASVSDIAIFQIQDFLKLGNESRINRPGVLGGNWQFRIKGDELTDTLAKKIKAIGKLYER